MDLGCIDMGCVEKQSEEINPEKQSSLKESVMSASKPVKNNRAKGAVRSSLNALNKLTSSITKPPRRKTSPLNWFPRKKVEPYLKRKIKMLQEVDGMHSTLDETLEDTNPHYSRVLREKIAIKEAAEKAMEARKAAMVEASWCRILQAARIESKEAEALLSKAEAAAAAAFVEARAVGVIMNDMENHFRIETSYSTTHTVSATFETAFEVDKQVAVAVKAAFVKLAHCPSINRDEFKELLRKISENPDSEENHHEISELNFVCESETGSELMKGQESSDMFSMASIVEMMLDRLRCLKEEELASLATIVATCGLNAALAESEDKTQYDVSSAFENVKNPCFKEPSRLSIAGRRRMAEAELPSLDKFLVKRLTRLEREILEAKNARKNEACDRNQSKLDETDTSSRTTDAALKEENEEAKMNNFKSTEVNNKKFQRAFSRQEVEEVPSLDKFLVKRLTRLEREVQEAKCRKAFEPIDEGRVTGSRNSDHHKDSLEKENTNLNRTDESLDKVLVKHVSKLEKAKLDFGASEQMGMKLKRKGAEKEEVSSEGSLDQVLVKHVSKLEREKMEFRAGEQMGRKGAKREQESSEGSLDQVLVKHVSKLERAKIEFLAGEGIGVKLKTNGNSRELESGEGSLDQDMVKHKSRLEREKMAAAAAPAEQVDDGVRHSVSRRQAREKELQEAWGGLSLGNSMQPHVSRLQRDKAAWREAEEEERKRGEMQEV